MKKANMESTAGIKMLFPVKRKIGVSHEEFIAYWFAHHMPVTIEMMGDRGWGYIGTVFKAAQDGNHVWDGMAQMFLDQPLANTSEGFGAKPVDSFHDRAVQPYFGWATREFVILDGSEKLPVQPLTLGSPFPTSRSGFFKVVNFVPTPADRDHQTFQSDWLSSRIDWVTQAMGQTDGFRYVVSLSLDPDAAIHAGLEELYFPNRAQWLRFQEIVSAHDSARWTLDGNVQTLFSDTEFVAIPLK